MLATELKASTDALTAEVATVVAESANQTPDVDVQTAITAVDAATASLKTLFPPK